MNFVSNLDVEWIQGDVSDPRSCDEVCTENGKVCSHDDLYIGEDGLLELCRFLVGYEDVSPGTWEIRPMYHIEQEKCYGGGKFDTNPPECSTENTHDNAGRLCPCKEAWNNSFITTILYFLTSCVIYLMANIIFVFLNIILLYIIVYIINLKSDLWVDMKYNNFGQKIKIVRIKATSIEILYHQHSNRSERFGVLPFYIDNSVNIVHT